MNNKIIRPNGLKGREVIDRIKSLMGSSTLNEGVNPYSVELTKIGPDGKAYAIVKENSKYFIKVSDSTTDLVSESFKYIGGLQNKNKESYSSYSKAIKQLNLKFMSINEAIGKSDKINVFINDNLINEHHPLKADMKLSAKKGIGDGSEYIVDKSGAELKYDSKEGKEEDGFGDNIADSTAEKDLEEVKLSENEIAIDRMISGDEVIEEKTKKTGFSISKAISEMDSIIESIDKDSKIDKIVKSLEDKGFDVTKDNIVMSSLFHAGGTISDEEAEEYLKKKV